MRSLLSRLQQEHPDSLFIMGGPQVMHHAHEYLNPAVENTIICNGEGEITFANYLRECLNIRPDYSIINGISFYKSGELITTPPEERLKDMNEIPSPFLNGIFDEKYLMSVFETNRGCPFRCGFCFWGAATNDRVYKFEEERIQKEITWICSEMQTPIIYIADANWGMLKRDIS